MQDEGMTLSTVEDLPSEADSSPAQSEEPQQESQPVSTIGETDTTDSQAAEQPGGEKEAAQPEAAKAEENVPFHEHPRWKEVLEDRNYWRDVAQKAVAAQPQQQQPAQKEEELDFTDITTLSQDRIRDWQEEDPVGYARNLARQTAYETEKRVEQMLQARARQQQEEEFKGQVNRQLDAYAQKNSDFVQMFNAGTLQQFIAQNPGHNLISAHQMLTAEKRQNDLQEAIKKAKEEGRREAEKNYLSKTKIRTIGTPPERAGVATDHNGDDMLKDTKVHGGLVSVIASRLQRQRQAR